MESGEVHISIITAVRNCSSTIRSLLESVERQSYLPYEHIIVDGESTDDTRAICEEYARRVPYRVKIISIPPKGIYDALNHGISHATGNVTGLLHGNDRFYSNLVLKKVAEAFRDDNDLDLVYSDIVHVKPDGKLGLYYSGKKFKPALLKWGFLFPHPSMYVSTSLYKKYGLYAAGYMTAADFEWTIRALLKGHHKIKYLPICSVAMSVGGISTTPYSRLIRNPYEKMKAWRANGYRLCPLRLFGRYFMALISLFNKNLHYNE